MKGKCNALVGILTLFRRFNRLKCLAGKKKTKKKQKTKDGYRIYKNAGQPSFYRGNSVRSVLKSSWPTDKTRKSHLIGPANTLGFRTFRNYRFCISRSSLWAASTRLTDLGGRSVTSWFALGPAAIHTPTSNRAVLTPITNSVGRRWTVKLFLPLQACIQYIKHLRMRGFGRKQRATMHA